MGKSLYSAHGENRDRCAPSPRLPARLGDGDGADRNYIRSPIAGFEAQRHTGRDGLSREALRPEPG
jgi:hypothetical protein